MICSRTSGSWVSAYWRNQASTRLTTYSSPGRTAAAAGSDGGVSPPGASETRSPPGARRTSRSTTLLSLPFAGRTKPAAVRSGRREGPRPGKQRRDLVAEPGPEEGGRGQQRLQVPAGVQAHPLQQEHQVVGGDVAGRLGGERAAADPAG